VADALLDGGAEDGPAVTGSRSRPLYHLDVSDQPAVSTEAVMEDVRDRIRADLHARLVLQGAGDDFADRAVFDEVDRLFAQAMAVEDPRALLLPARLDGPWKPILSLDFPGHRNKLIAAPIRFVKTRFVLPAVRWLYEFSHENFRRQHQLNLAMMAIVQTLAADHARLKARLAELERRPGA
jgi:hypothetical protein